MSAVIELVKTDKGSLVACDNAGKSRLDKIGQGEIVLADIRRPRNLAFHRKAMSLFRLAFNQWNPGEKSIAGMPAKKSFDVFRKEVVIQSGYYEVALGLDGEPRLEALSMKFDAMDEDTFNEVYDAVVQTLLAGILQGMSQEDAERLALAVQEEGY